MLLSQLLLKARTLVSNADARPSIWEPGALNLVPGPWLIQDGGYISTAIALQYHGNNEQSLELWSS